MTTNVILERPSSTEGSAAATSALEAEVSRLPAMVGVVEVVDKCLLPPTERLAIAWDTRYTGRLMADVLGVQVGGVVYLPYNDISLTIGTVAQIDQIGRGGLRPDGLTRCMARFRRIS